MTDDERNGKHEARNRAIELAERTHRLVAEAERSRNLAERGVAGMAAALNKLADLEIDLAAIISEGQRPGD